MNKAEHDQLITVRRQIYESHSPPCVNLSLFRPFRSVSPSVLYTCGRKIFKIMNYVRCIEKKLLPLMLGRIQFQVFVSHKSLHL